MAALEEIILDQSADVADIEMANVDLVPAKAKLQACKNSLERKEAALGVDARQELRHLVSSPYLQRRMKARALKARMQTAIRARKFELDRVERNLHRKKTGKGRDELCIAKELIFSRPQIGDSYSRRREAPRPEDTSARETVQCPVQRDGGSYQKEPGAPERDSAPPHRRIDLEVGRRRRHLAGPWARRHVRQQGTAAVVEERRRPGRNQSDASTGPVC